MATVQVPIDIMCPDATGFAYQSLLAGTNIRGLFAAYTHGQDSKHWGIVRVPQDYSSTPVIIVRSAANSTAGQVLRLIVATIVLDTSAGWDASALTAETAQNQTMSTTAYRPADTSFSLSTTPAAGKDLYCNIQRNGSSGSDTLVVDSLLFGAYFQYST
jgi:hypothetical protein